MDHLRLRSQEEDNRKRLDHEKYINHLRDLEDHNKAKDLEEKNKK